jgi:low temperature requirement protein LtrA
MLAEGNRPIRILLFGGIFLAWIIMTLLAKLFGIDTDSSDEIELAFVIVIAVSVFSGFAISYVIFAFLENLQQEHEEGKR